MVSSVLLTLQSMLASCKVRMPQWRNVPQADDAYTITSHLFTLQKKERPPDDARYSKNAPISPKDTKWVFHDDTV